MAIVKGVNEIVHLPLYDSLFVRPGKHLSDLVSANVLKFFVNIQGKTKLETNMQSSALLPHWSTFEARALRVVVSDLPETNSNGARKHEFDCDKLVAARESLKAFHFAVDDAKHVSKDYEECLGLLRFFCDRDRMGRILELQRDLRSVRDELIAILSRTRIKPKNPDAVQQFLKGLEALETKGEETYLAPKLDRAIECLNDFSKLTDLASRLKQHDLSGIDACVATAEKFVVSGQRRNGLEKDPASAQRLGQLLYNSVTTLFVGEKIMIQMPTWFFPAGAGPYTDNGEVVTNGFPTPQATFNFAEPVTIDTQQHFRVELEIPESDAFEEFQSIHGPFLIWVVLDGYMKRDVQ